MRILRTVLSLVCMVGALAAVSAAEAQACGEECVQDVCANPVKWRGQGDPGGYNANDCRSGTCDECPEPLVGDNLPATEILRAIGSSSLEELQTIAEEQRGRLILNPERRLVAVLDAACGGGSSIASVLIVSAEKARALDHLGVKHFEDFVAESDTDG